MSHESDQVARDVDGMTFYTHRDEMPLVTGRPMPQFKAVASATRESLLFERYLRQDGEANLFLYQLLRYLLLEIKDMQICRR